jgi:transposase
MSNIWRLPTMDLQELLRRVRAGESRGAIVRAMHMSPNTVKAYRQWANQQGLLDGPLPDLPRLESLRRQTYASQPTPRHPNVSSLEKYRVEIAELVNQNRRPRAIWGLLQSHHPGCAGSESAVRRLVKGLKAQELPEATVRIETEPGEVAQVDFGYVGELVDPQCNIARKAWVFVTPALAFRCKRDSRLEPPPVCRDCVRPDHRHLAHLSPTRL